MSIYAKSAVFFTGKIIQNNAAFPFFPINQIASLLQVRYRHTKHWNPKFKKLRREKVIKVDLPQFDTSTGDITEEMKRTKMKECGVVPPRPWVERPVFIGSTGSIFEPYVPPEGDGKFSIITQTGAKQKITFVEKKSKSMLAIRKIKQFEEDFKLSIFAEDARDIYIKAHEALSNKSAVDLIQCVTEKAYPEMMHNITDKTIHWKFVQSLEPARVVHARTTSVITKQNIFSQITVRFHTQQILAIYDRFGRLMHGSEILSKDVLEYVVFEKHSSNEYGTWRIHGKIIPSWMPPREPSAMTYVQKEKNENENENEDKDGGVSTISTVSTAPTAPNVPTESVRTVEAQPA